MKFEKGKSGNPSGRPKGTKNKVTTDVKQFIQDIIDDNAESLAASFAFLDPSEQWRIAERLFAYIVPKQSATKTEVDFNNLTEEQIDAIVGQLHLN